MPNIILESTQSALQGIVDSDSLAQSRNFPVTITGTASDAQFSQSDVPIGSIPVELLQKIMVYCSNGLGTTIPISLDRAPWSLTHVCCLWRRIALTTPDLWAKLTIFSNPNGQFNVTLIEEVLKRNIHFPMEISLQWNNRNPVRSAFHRQDSSYLSTLCHTIFREGIKVRRLTLKPESRLFSELRSQLESIASSVFDSLEEVTLIFLGEIPDIPEITTHALGKAPKLTIGSTSSCGWGRPHRTLFGQLNTSHVTNLSFPGIRMGVRTVYALLRDSPLLVSLDIAVFFYLYGDPFNPIRDESLHLPRLRRLAIHAKGSQASSALEEIFTHITTPGLSILKIAHIGKFVHRDGSILTKKTLPFLEGCSALSRLHLYRCGDTDLHAVLQAIPSLQSLNTFQSGFLQVLAIQDILVGGCGSNLHQIRCGILDADVKYFLQLLEAQWDSERDSNRSQSGCLVDVRLRVKGTMREEYGAEITRIKQVTGTRYNVEFIPYIDENDAHD